MRVRALVVLLAVNATWLLIAGCSGNAFRNLPTSAPMILTAPVNQAVTAGQSATFSVVATGTTPLVYQWNKNGMAINGATSSSYVTPPTTQADDGAQFNVVVSNPVGSLATPAVTLTVNLPPAITVQPASQAVTAGQTATFSVTATGTAPLSYQWNKNGAAISGATSAAYTTPPTSTADSGAQFNVLVSNLVGSVTSSTVGLTVNPPPVAPAITSANSATFVAGAAGSFTVTTTGTPAPSITETGSLPGGVTFMDNGNGTATLGGTPTAGSGKVYSITFTATNGVGSPASQSFTLTVNESPTITSSNSAAFTLGTSGLFGVLTTGFPAPSITETGALPTGVTFTDNGNGSGKLAGIPTAGAGKTFPVTFTASNGLGSPVTQSFTLTVNQAPAITSANNTAFTVGTPGSFAVITTGFPTPTLTETGALPAGVTFLDNGNGVGTLSGTPAAGTGGTFPITFTATNGVGTPALQTFTLTVKVVATVPAITSVSSVTFSVGVASTFSVTATGTPTPTLTEAGTLPSGVTFKDNGNGTATLAGTPAAGTGKTYPITVTASNGVGSPSSQTFTLTVNQAAAITSPNSAAFNVGASASFSVLTTGYPAPSLGETGALPSGVTFKDNGNGTATLSGAPASGSAGTYSLTLTATNGVGTPATQTFTLTASNTNSAPAITSASSTTFTVGTAGTFSVTTTGTPTPTLTEAGALPSGVTFKDNGNGTATLAGTPAAGTGKTYPITVTASNGTGSPSSQTFTLAVNQAPAITSPNITTFNVGASASFTVLTTGFPAPSLSETGALPGGATFKDNGNGTATLSGTAASGSAGTYPLMLTATNGIGTPATQTFTLTVNNANSAPTITSASSTTFTVGTAGTFSVTTTGTPTPTLTETGALPGGVTFVDNHNGTASLSGTPAAGTAATYPLTFTATNSVGTAATQNFTLTVTAGSSGIVCGSGHESVLTGQFAFYFQGFDSKGPVAIAGSFSADGTGKVALLPSVEDINTSAGVQTNVAINSAGSSYSVGADNRGCLTIATTSGTARYAISLGSLNTSNVAARGRMIEVDSTGTLGSGVIHLQDPTAFPTAISGNFVFDVSSTQSLSTTTPNRFAMAGSISASGGAITSGEADFNLSGSVDGGAAGPLAITNGTYSVASNGRGTLSFDVAGAGTFNAAIYIVSATEFYMVDTDPQSAASPLFVGGAQSQTGPFTTSSLSKNTVFYSIGLCGGCGPNGTVAPDLSVGVISVPSAGNFTLTGDQNLGGTVTPQSLSGAYTVDSSGRVALQSGGSTVYVLYLQTTDRGFLLSTGADVGEGSTDGQSAGPFTNASVTGAYVLASMDPPEQNVSDSSGVGTFDGLGTVSGTGDSASLGSPASSSTFSESYTVTNGTNTPGRGTITENGVTRFIFYIISKSRIVGMDVMSSDGTPNKNPGITTGRQ